MPKGLQLAAARGVATRVVEHRRHATREAFDAALAAEIDRFAPRLVALAGFMRILTPGFVARYRERLLNIHPSLLPAFPGAATRTRARWPRASRCMAARCISSPPSSTTGRSWCRPRCRCAPATTPRALAARVLQQEHVIYPRAVRWFLDGRLAVGNGVVHVKGSDAQLVLAAD